ncbi:hypothetical protein MTX78_09520 [Hymenobacter tibetensis]|uniref:Uncharacterized protein n=1 Tax=Hymenobacter tibetensis TaxID=497967 RepID=A0ABY4D2Q0_9BACT|nr:hypothetical protein [Hymenobacter tibetensis]UOG76821.1 hypothetical protein MTX78_09520 [Hymenobacter tibetensis]
MEATYPTCHPLFRAFILRAEIIAGRRQEASGVVPMTFEEVQAEVEKIRAAMPALVKLELHVQDECLGPLYSFSYLLHGAKRLICPEGDIELSLSLVELTRSLKQAGLQGYTLPFPMPIIKEWRGEPQNRAELEVVNRELDTMVFDFKSRVKAAIAAVPTPEGRVELVETVLNGFNSLEWIAGNYIGEIVEQAVDEAWEFVSDKHDTLLNELDSLSGVLGDKNQRREASPIPSIQTASKLSPATEVNSDPTKDSQMLVTRRRVVLLHFFRGDLGEAINSPTEAEALFLRYGDKGRDFKTKAGEAVRYWSDAGKIKNVSATQVLNAVVADLKYIKQYLAIEQQAEADKYIRELEGKRKGKQ